MDAKIAARIANGPSNERGSRRCGSPERYGREEGGSHFMFIENYEQFNSELAEFISK